VAGKRAVRGAGPAGGAGGVRAERHRPAVVPAGVVAGRDREPARAHAAARGAVPGGRLVARDDPEPDFDGTQTAARASDRERGFEAVDSSDGATRLISFSRFNW